MPSFWTNPLEFETVVQQNLAMFYDKCVSRRKLFAMLRKQVWLHVYFGDLGRKPCNLYLPEYGLDLGTLIVCDAIRTHLQKLV